MFFNFFSFAFLVSFPFNSKSGLLFPFFSFLNASKKEEQGVGDLVRVQVDWGSFHIEECGMAYQNPREVEAVKDWLNIS